MTIRLESRISIAYLNPLPSSPSKFEADTGVFLKTNSAVLDPYIPSFPCWGLISNPGESLGTMKALTPLYP